MDDGSSQAVTWGRGGRTHTGGASIILKACAEELEKTRLGKVGPESDGL